MTGPIQTVAGSKNRKYSNLIDTVYHHSLKKDKKKTLLTVGTTWDDSEQKLFVKSLISGGNYCDVYHVLSKDGKYALKVETKLFNRRNPLEHENDVYKELQKRGYIKKTSPFLIVHDFFEAGDKIAMMLPMMANDLDTFVSFKYDKCLNEFQATACILSLIFAVNKLHSIGYIHRDIKPANVLVDCNSGTNDNPLSIKLADFGLAKKFIEFSNGRKVLVKPQDKKCFVGTLHYASLRQLKNHDASQSCDIYGACLTVVSVCVHDPLPWRSTLDLKLVIKEKMDFDALEYLSKAKMRNVTKVHFSNVLSQTIFGEYGVFPKYKELCSVFNDVFMDYKSRASLKF